VLDDSLVRLVYAKGVIKSVIIRSTSGLFEPRFRNGKDLLTRLSANVSSITWNRTGDEISNTPGDSDCVFSLDAAYGNGLRNSFSHFQFFVYVLRKLSEINPSLIYACDFDTLLPAVLWRRNRKVTIVFDQFDPFSTRLSNSIYFKIASALEHFLSKKSNFRITANARRINPSSRSEWLELKNIYPIAPVKSSFKVATENKVLFYGGVLANDRGLLLCAEAIANSKEWEFQIYGQGSEAQSLRSLNSPKVVIHKPLPHPDLMGRAFGSDLYLALYDPSKFHNKFTASNKLFEAAQLGIPILASMNTEIGDIVEAFDLGFVIEYGSFDSLAMALREIASLGTLRSQQIKENLDEFYRKELKSNQQNWNDFFIDLKCVMGAV
jgi:glycosyltransferase involved in cell wall biosynthesis